MKIDWEKHLNKYKDKIISLLLAKGVDFMLKNLWQWIWKSAKTRAIEMVKLHRAVLVNLIETYADPQQLADKIIEFLCEKIRKV